MKARSIIVLFISFTVFHLAQAQVQVKLQQPPPNQLRAADLWKLTLDNTTNTTYRVRLEGTLDEATEGRVADGRSGVMSLPPGRKSITYDDVKRGGSVNFKAGKWRDAFTRTGNAPSGDYTICIYVKTEAGDELGRDCVQQTVEIVSAPSLISPANGDTIPEGQLPTFTWLPPTPAPRDVKYSLKIVEVLGNQSPSDAMQRNAAWFEKGDIRTTTFQYPTSAKKLEKGKKYAWKVTAFQEGQTLATSDVWSFVLSSCGTLIIIPTVQCASVGSNMYHFTLNCQNPANPITDPNCVMVVNSVTLQQSGIPISPSTTLPLNVPPGQTATISGQIGPVAPQSVNFSIAVSGPQFSGTYTPAFTLPSCVDTTCVVVLTDSLWCINPATGRYGYTMTIQNPTGSNCYLQVSSVPGGGTVSGIGGMPVPSLPPGVSTVSGHFNGVVPVNNQLCLRFYCVQPNDTCSFVRCFTIPSCGGACQCGTWDSTKVTFGATTIGVANGGTVSGVIAPQSVSITPKLTCVPASCPPSYQWTYTGPTSGSGTTVPIQIPSTQAGLYTVRVNGFCGTQSCDSLRVFVRVDTAVACNLQIVGTPNQGDTLCVGSPVTIQWTGTTPSGQVTLSLIDIGNWVVYQMIGVGIPNAGSYAWTIPQNIPCSPVKKWQFYVEDVNKVCWKYGPEFYIKCCPPADSCLSVVRDSVRCLPPQGQHQRYQFALTLNNLTGQQCNMLQIVPQIPNSGNVLNVSHTSLPTGTTVVTGELTDFVPANNPFCLRVICTQGTKKCEIVYCLPLPSCDSACHCGTWDSTKVTFGATTIGVANGGTVTGVIALQSVSITPKLTCIPASCPPSYQWTYTGPTSGSGTSIPIQITPTQAGTYTVTVKGWCGTQRCDSIRIYVKVDTLTTEPCDSTPHTHSWHVTIEENPMLTNCGSTTNIPVAGASNCTTAEQAAWNLLLTLLATPNCIVACPAGCSMSQPAATCTEEQYQRSNGSWAKRWQVTWSWTCVP